MIVVNFFDGTTGHQLAPWQAAVPASDQQHQADTPMHLQPQSQDTGITGLQARTITTNWPPTANIFDATAGHQPAPWQAVVQASDQQCQTGSPKYQLQTPEDTSSTRPQAPTTTTSWRQTGEGYRATDMGQPSLDVNQLSEPNSCQYVDAGRRKLDEQLANAKNTVENYFGYADLPAPERMLSVPEGRSHLGNNFLLESTPGQEVTMHDEGNGTGVQNITGNKRSYMESILTTQSLNSVEPFEKSRSERTTGSVPDDDDLLSSILVGRRSSILKMKPTPPPSETVSVKRRRTAPRASASKRKVFMDDTMVLHGDIIRQHLTNTEDIRRVRKKAPCTRPEIWMIQNQFLEDEIFGEPIFSGMSSELICSLGQRYDPSIIRVSQNDESIALFGAAKNRELSMTPNVINETEPERIIESEITRNDGEVQSAETVVQTEVQHLDNDTQMQLNANTTMPELRTLHPETDGITEPIIVRNDGEAQPAMALVQTKDQHNYIATQIQINSNTIIPELKSSHPETEGITEPIIARNDGEAQPANTFVQTAELHNYNDTQMQMNANTVIPELGTLQPEHMGKIAEMEFARGGSAVANAEETSVALGIGLSSPVDLVSVDICNLSTDSVEKPSGSPQIDVACLVPDQKLDSQSVEKDASVVDLCIEKGVEPVEVSEIQVVVGTESCASFEKDASAVNLGQGVEFIEAPELHDGNIIGAGTESGATGEFLLEENRGGLSVENRTDNPTDSVDLPLETVSPAIDLVVVTEDQAEEETAKIEEGVVNEATEKGYDGRDRTSYGVCSQEPKTDYSLSDGQDASLNNVEKSGGQEVVPQDVRDAETASFDHADVEIHDDVENETVEHDTEFLNFDDDDDDDGGADDDYDDCMRCPEDTRILENSGWSSRTRAVAKYLQTVFDKEADHGKKVIPLDNLLSGKTRKEASRMFFESLVLKTRDYIHVEQENPFDNIIIKPRVKLLKSEF